LVQRGESPYPICHAEPFTGVILSPAYRRAGYAKNLLRGSG
jgi:hypothetical protein